MQDYEGEEEAGTPEGNPPIGILFNGYAKWLERERAEEWLSRTGPYVWPGCNFHITESTA